MSIIIDKDPADLIWPDDFINKIICGDCLEVMKKIPDGAVDLVLTDPPYGVRKAEDWDDRDLFIDQLVHWLMACKKASPLLVWFCAGKMIPYILENRPDDFFRFLVWNKPPGCQYAGASHNNLWYSSEPILLFGAAEDWSQKGKESPMEYSVFNAATIPSAKFGHPTTKPIRLMKWLVNHHSNDNDIILDPFLGSGTTAVAAKQLGRRFIGIDINMDYCKIAEDQLRQGELF